MVDKLFRSDADWDYLTEPQAGLDGRRTYSTASTDSTRPSSGASVCQLQSLSPRAAQPS